MPLDDLVASARVPVEEQVEEQVTERGASAPGRPDDEAAGHLPGGVRPYGA